MNLLLGFHNLALCTLIPFFLFNQKLFSSFLQSLIFFPYLLMLFKTFSKFAARGGWVWDKEEAEATIKLPEILPRLQVAEGTNASIARVAALAGWWLFGTGCCEGTKIHSHANKDAYMIFEVERGKSTLINVFLHSTCSQK